MEFALRLYAHGSPLHVTVFGSPSAHQALPEKCAVDLLIGDDLPNKEFVEAIFVGARPERGVKRGKEPFNIIVLYQNKLAKSGFLAIAQRCVRIPPVLVLAV